MRGPLDVREHTQNSPGAGSTAPRPQRQEAATPDDEVMELRSVSPTQPQPPNLVLPWGHGEAVTACLPRWGQWGWVILCGGCPGHCGVLSSIPSPVHLMPGAPLVVRTRHVPRHVPLPLVTTH